MHLQDNTDGECYVSAGLVMRWRRAAGGAPGDPSPQRCAAARRAEANVQGIEERAQVDLVVVAEPHADVTRTPPRTCVRICVRTSAQKGGAPTRAMRPDQAALSHRA